jgi:hypothetical protein
MTKGTNDDPTEPCAHADANTGAHANTNTNADAHPDAERSA